MTEKESFFETTDLGLAAALHLVGFDIEDFYMSEKQVFFCFEDSKELRITVNDYWDDRLTVRAKSFYYSVKNAKNMLYKVIDGR